MSENGRQRLTSWKEIGGHLGRDVRTVLRWEKDRGLPIHRVPGATGRVVFAYTDELDAWAQGAIPKTLEPVLDVRLPADPPAPTESEARRRSRIPLVAAAAIIAATGFIAWRVGASNVIAATGSTMRTSGSVVRGGEILRFSPVGALKKTFTFENRPRFTAGPYGPPWGITDYRVQSAGGKSKVAVTAHHYEWWPSLVTVLDDALNPHGTFVNAGWVERVHWVTPDRLVIGGFSNALDGGMIALLDANALGGQSPSLHGSAFDCTSCSPGGPLRYIVLPRSEVNRVTGSPFNRVVLIVKRDALVARTIEVPISAAGAAADALYEFTPSLDVVRASYSDRYWEIHHELEAAGRITHTREQCPDRDGPREIRVWEPESGWVAVATGSSAARSSLAQTRR